MWYWTGYPVDSDTYRSYVERRSWFWTETSNQLQLTLLTHRVPIHVMLVVSGRKVVRDVGPGVAVHVIVVTTGLIEYDMLALGR